MKEKTNILLFFIFLFVFAKWGPAINFNTSTQFKGEPFVVAGEGKVSVTPDVARLTFGVQQTGESLKQVQGDVNAKTKTLTAVFKKLGIEEKDIKSTSYNIYPQYDYTNGQKITGYQISTDYEVVIKDFDKVNDAIVAGTAAGANIVRNISFDLNDSVKIEKTNEARAKAVGDAKTKAEGLAKAAGITLGKIVNVSENQRWDTRPDVLKNMGVVKTAEEVSITQPEIQPGQTEVNVSVSISYELR